MNCEAVMVVWLEIVESVLIVRIRSSLGARMKKAECIKPTVKVP